MEVYIRAAMDLEGVATVFSRGVNVASVNRSSYQREQRRDSMNRGGRYFLFEVFGLEILLVQNLGEAHIPERSAWPFYLAVYGEGAGSDFLASACDHVASILRKEGLEAEVDDLGA
jgi:hypothetical protein